jgi:hypothetical protein
MHRFIPQGLRERLVSSWLERLVRARRGGSHALLRAGLVCFRTESGQLRVSDAFCLVAPTSMGQIHLVDIYEKTQ